MDDDASIQVLEAVLVVVLLLTAALFVLTFSLPTSPTNPVRDRLVHQADDALATFYDLPLNAPRFGNNTLSIDIVQALEGHPGNLTGRFNASLPPGVEYNVLLSNGYGSTTVWSAGTPPGASVSVHHLLEPRWSYTWLASDADFYDSSSAQGVYALPVLDSNPVTMGGTTVDVVATGLRMDPALGNSGFSLGTSTAIAQVAPADDTRLPAVSLTYVNATGVPTGYVDLVGVGGLLNGTNTHAYTVLVNDTGTAPVPRGTLLTVHLPRGWTGAASTDPNWTVLSNDSDPTVAGDLVAELRAPLDGASRLTFTYQGTYHNDTPDLYVLRARLGAPTYGRAVLVVRERNDTVANEGEVPAIHVAAPASTGSTEATTWMVLVSNPRSFTSASPGSGGTGATLRVDQVTLTDADGLPVLGAVTTMLSATCPGTWVRTNGTLLTWSASGTCLVGPNHVLSLPFVLTGTGTATPPLQRGPVLPKADYANAFGSALQDRITAGFARGRVPAPNALQGYPGWDTTAGTRNLTTRPHVSTSALQGSTTYRAQPVSAFRDTLALGRVDTSPSTVALGRDVSIQTDVRSLLLALSDAGIPARVTTSIYPPWVLDDRFPVARYVHDETLTTSNPVDFVAIQDLNGDGRPDVVAVTGESQLVGLDGGTGVKLAGFEKPIEASNGTATLQATAFGELNLSTGPAFAVGTSSGQVLLYDTSFQQVGSYGAGSSQVVALSTSHDWTGDGVPDVAVAWANDTVGVVDVIHHRLLWAQSGVGSTPSMAEGNLGLARGHALAASLGAKAGASGTWEAVNTTMTITDQNGTPDQQAVGAYNKANQATQKVVIYEATAGVDGFGSGGRLVWTYGGGNLQNLATADLNGDGATEVLGSTSGGSVFAVNGTSATDPYDSLALLGTSGMLKLQVLDDRHASYITTQGNLFFTNDSFATEHAYYQKTVSTNGTLAGQNLTHSLSLSHQFPGVQGLDVVNTSVSWMSGSLGHLWVTRDGNHLWKNVTYTLYDPDGVPVASRVGLTWQDVRWPGGQGTWGLVSGVSCNVSLSLCNDGVIARTGDGGSSWHELDVSGLSGRPVTSMKVAPDGTVVAVGRDGGFWLSPASSQGTTWTRHDVTTLNGTIHAPFTNVYFFNATTGYVVGPNALLLRTRDGGVSWSRIELPTNATIRDVTFRGALRGLAVGDNGTVLTTPDGGLHWVLNMDPSDPVQAKEQWTTVSLATPGLGWFGGGDSSRSDETDVGFLAGYVRYALAQTEPLPSLLPANVTAVRSARILADQSVVTGTNVSYAVSDAGCSGWGASAYDGDVVDLSSSPGTTLCLQANLTATFSDGTSKLWTPWVFALHLDLNVTYSDGHHGNLTVGIPLRTASAWNDGASTAVRNGTDGTLSLPRIHRFWAQQVRASVAAILPYDATGTGQMDVAVGTADSSSVGSGTVTGRHVILFDGATGIPLAKSATLPGSVVSLHLVNLRQLTGDHVRDLLVVAQDSGSSAWYAVALDGRDLHTLWTKPLGDAVTAVATGPLRNASAADVVLGTQGTSLQNGQVLDYRADGSAGSVPNLLWSTVPVLKGRYAETYHVPEGALYGPYVVESEVSWTDQTTNLTQRARLVSDFVVTPPGGILPPSPVYGVDVVLWYEDWR